MASNKRYANNQEYRIAKYDSNRKWVASNRELVRFYGRLGSKKFAEKYPDRVAASQRLWSSRNQSRVNYLRAFRRAAERSATPKWSEKEKIALVYSKAKEYGFQVDHIVPLNNPKVCGLHVWANLQLLSGVENRRKKNLYWPDMP